MRILALCFFVFLSAAGFSGEMPPFESDTAADAWLRENSPYYRMMALSIESRAPYTFRRSDLPFGGQVRHESGAFIIELSDSLTGSKRVSILIFEITNAYQSERHEEIDRGAAEGRITTSREFGILHELVELDGLRHHRSVLEELDTRIHGIPADMLRWINPKLTALSDYAQPYAYDFIKAQEAGGHTKHYHDWFPRQVPPPENPRKE